MHDCFSVEVTPVGFVHVFILIPSTLHAEVVHVSLSSELPSDGPLLLSLPSSVSSPSSVVDAWLGTEVADPVGAVTAFAFKVTAVCASALPFNTAPVFMEIAVCDSMIPLTLEVVPSVAWPPTCQKMFLACAPPIKVTIAPLPTVRSCAI